MQGCFLELCICSEQQRGSMECDIHGVNSFTIVKGTLQWNGKYVVYCDRVSCIETKRTLASKIRDWQILIENKEGWKKKLSGLHICKEEKGRMKINVKGRKAKQNKK